MIIGELLDVNLEGRGKGEGYAFAVVVEFSVVEFPCDVDSPAVNELEELKVGNDHDVFPGTKGDSGEGELDALGEAHALKVAALGEVLVNAKVLPPPENHLPHQGHLP